MNWGIVATIKAPTHEILKFVAHHLDIGADHMFIYLDDRNDDAQVALESHPKITVTRTNQAYWTAGNGKRPPKHQGRQSRNATHAYNAAAGKLDWLLHIDVDEFLWPHRPMSELLSDISAQIQIARVRPIEALAPPQDQPTTDFTYFKGYIPARGQRQQISQDLFPNFGKYVQGGFLSHIQGKVFVRTGMTNIQIRIHNAFQNGDELSEKIEIADVDLCHIHVTSWEDWYAHYRYRHKKGSYRSELKSAMSPENGGLTLHQLFTFLEEKGGDSALWDFFKEICVASPELVAALDKRGLLRVYSLDLEAKRLRHFPQCQLPITQ